MADIDPINTQPLSDDQELAKVLAGVSQQADEPAAATDSDTVSTDAAATPPLPQDDTPTPVTPPAVDEPAAPAEDTASVSTLPPEEASVPQSTLPTEDPAPVSAPVAPMGMSTSTSGSSELDGIKKEALGELRPLVDKLNVAPEEKFDTYLLLLRSTDDKALIGPAHEAAKNIPDETRRAQALLDIIKEIDFLSQNGQ